MHKNKLIDRVHSAIDRATEKVRKLEESLPAHRLNGEWELASKSSRLAWGLKRKIYRLNTWLMKHQ